METARLHLRRFGEDKMTIVGIARALGMSHANVYRYFPGKAAIVEAVLDLWLSRVESFITRSRPQARHRRGAHRARGAGNPPAPPREAPVRTGTLRILPPRDPEPVRCRGKAAGKIATVFRDLIRKGIEDGEFRPVDPARAATVLEDATAFFLHPAVMPSALSNRGEERARNVVRHVLAGFAAEPNAEP